MEIYVKASVPTNRSLLLAIFQAKKKRASLFITCTASNVRQAFALWFVEQFWHFRGIGAVFRIPRACSGSAMHGSSLSHDDQCSNVVGKYVRNINNSTDSSVGHCPPLNPAHSALCLRNYNQCCRLHILGNYDRKTGQGGESYTLDYFRRVCSTLRPPVPLAASFCPLKAAPSFRGWLFFRREIYKG